MPLTYATPLTMQDPGFLFWAPLSTAEPTHAALASTYDADVWSASWIPLGCTEEGSKINREITVEPIRVAELFDQIRFATVEKKGSISFGLTNFTLNTLKRVFNGGTLATVSGAGVTLSSSYVEPTPGNEVRAMIGWESLDHTVRAIMYQTINSGSIEMAMQRAPSKTVLPCTFNFETPASGIQIKWYAAGVGRLGA